MGRQKTIDRDHVLTVAEGIVAIKGAGALTIDAVAKAAGITKGGVQSCFRTKESLIAAMLQRWMDAQQGRFDELAGTDPSPIAKISAHVQATKEDDEESNARVANLLTILLQQPEHLAEARRWYAERAGDLNADDAMGRNARLAFLAAEGAFFLRFLGLIPMDKARWEEVFDDIERLMS